jgi:hypothetical protein
LFARFVKNLPYTITNREIFPWLQGHRDDLQTIRMAWPLSFLLSFPFSRQNTAGIAVR